MKNNYLPKKLALITILLLGSFILFPANTDHQDLYPGKSWVNISKPSKYGYSTEELKIIRETLKKMNTTGLMTVIKGKVLFEYGDTKQVSYIASCRKSILAMLYGIYSGRGLIDLKKTLNDLKMDDVGGLLAIEKKAKVRHLISARSGVYRKGSNPGDNSASAPKRGSKKPGSYYLYSNWDFNAAGTAFEIQTKTNIFDALEKELAIPLGLEDFDRKKHKKGGNLKISKYPSYHMYFSTRDMARLGLLALNMGKWKGKQIIPEKWCKRMVSVITPSSGMNPEFLKNGEFGYGYMWWVWDNKNNHPLLEGGYTARGAYGQFITIIPKLNMVIAHKTAVPPYKSSHWTEYKEIVVKFLDASGK